MSKKLDYTWDDNPVDVTQESNFIWSIANKLRGDFKEDQYGDVIIPMTVLRRFECTLKDTKDKVVNEYKKNPKTPYQALCKKSGFNFYNVSEFTLTELLNDADHLASNLKAYVNGFSDNAVLIFAELEFDAQIKKMEKGGCLYTVVKAFSELELSPDKVDSIKMGYIFENLIGRFFQNESQGQYYTGRDIIKCMMSILISEGCDDIFESGKEITVLDQAAGTGGMLSTAYAYLKHYNPNCNVRLFGQEYNPISHAVGLAEMLIKGQDARNFLQADTFKTDCFDDVQMRFLLENPPFGTAWSGENAKDGQEEAVKKEHSKGLKGRFGAGLPSGSDGQLLFMQSAINKMDEKYGRAAIIENGSPLFTGGTSSGESQIRRWMLESDLIEAIIALPTDLFYNTNIPTYIWVLSKNKRKERKGKIQLIDATSINHKLRKPLGNKRVELIPEDRKKITELYVNFKENEYSKIYDNEEFLYREYTVMQPLQRSYAITEERIKNMLLKGSLNFLYDEAKVYELEHSIEEISDKNQKKLDKFNKNKSLYNDVLNRLKKNISDKVYLSKDAFEPVINQILDCDKKIIAKVIDGLSIMDKNAEIQKDKNGVIYDKDTKDIELVKYQEKIDDYMKREVLPHVPDAKAFFEARDEDATFEMDIDEKTVKIGAEIPFIRYFYKYQQPRPSEDLLKEFFKLDKSVNERIAKLVK